jgi:hypothetical protein
MLSKHYVEKFQPEESLETMDVEVMTFCLWMLQDWNNVGINLEHRKFSIQEMAHVHTSVRHHNGIHLLTCCNAINPFILCDLFQQVQN